MATILNEINKGAYAPYNNMTMFRMYDSQTGFKTRFKINGIGNNQVLDQENNIVVPYLEYFKNGNGDIVNELTRHKSYVVVNVPELYYTAGEEMAGGGTAVGGEVKQTAWNAANDWFTELARTPANQQEQQVFIGVFVGIMDSIEYTLAGLPQDIPDGYVLQFRP